MFKLMEMVIQHSMPNSKRRLAKNGFEAAAKVLAICLKKNLKSGNEAQQAKMKNWFDRN